VESANAGTVKHLRIIGMVQGVGFREAMRWKADELGITGWVRNRRDGSVEAMIAGSPAAVQRMIAWAQHGPAVARIDRVEVNDADGEFTRFERWPTD
jgi:acylphosphatase